VKGDSKQMEIGVIAPLRDGGRCFEHVTQFDLAVCQLSCWDSALATREVAATVVKEAQAAGVRVCAVWAGWPGPRVWNFREGPVTLGLVPEQYRAARVAALKQWADFATWIGAPAIITHCGFIPENLTDPAYPAVVAAIHEVAAYCAERDLGFWFETGQETPVVLLRTIGQLGLSNLGLNLDPANLLMYGKANPIDALDMLGSYVRNIHVKDGHYPTDGEHLGHEAPVGQGQVDYPRFVARLAAGGFTGEWIIEREISGEQQQRDIRQTIGDLRHWSTR
jgi:L-ribulose-5-phosphate 3-epimerase